ncbi:MAG: hypothetical protein V3V15_03925 [Sphingorhabdus sp.]
MLNKTSILLAGCLVLAACSDGGVREEASYDVAENEAAESADSVAGSPNISPTAAPGVAFNYRYAFRVPDVQIAAVQEVHAAACETLGISRCRITGMRYQLIDEDEVEGFLSFKLDPMIARKFGKEAISSVEKAEGILVDSEISGRDVGTQIDNSQRRSSDMGAELKRIERRLAAKGLGDRERSELQEQAERLRGRLSSEKETRREDEASLATTPMQFSYSSGDGILGLGRNPLSGALDTSIGSFVTMASFVIVAIGVILPWLILAILLLLLWRSPLGRGARGWFTKQAELAEPQE